MEEVNKLLEKLIPQSVRTLLPQIGERLKEIEKIEKNRKKID